MGMLKAGVSKINITPYVGIWLSGFAARRKPSEGVGDELYARSLVLDDGTTRLAIASCDIATLDKGSVSSIRRLAAEASGIDEESIMIGTTHTHSGPNSSHLRGMGKLEGAWLEVLEKKVSGSIYVASRSLKEAKLGVGRGEALIGINRREKDSDGKMRLGENRRGPIDPEVGVLRVDGSDGKPIALVINYTCHPVVLGGSSYHISADYPGYTTGLVEKAYDGAVALFINGAAGDINPLKVGGTLEDAKRFGNIVGAEAIKAFEGITTASEVNLNVARKEVVIPFENLPPAEEIKKFIEGRLKELGADEDARRRDFLLDWAEDAIKAVKEGKTGGSEALELQAFKVGEGAFVAIPGEVFVEIGLNLKRNSPFKHTFVCSYTNGCIGYIPTARAFPEGGYEVDIAPKVYGLYKLTPEIEGIVTEACKELLAKLR